MQFVFKSVNPCETGKIIDKMNVIFITSASQELVMPPKYQSV